MTTAAEIAQRAGARAGRYFPELEGVAVRARVMRCRERNASSIYHVQLEVPDYSRHIVVKLPWWRDTRWEANGQAGAILAFDDRPRLGPLCPPEQKYRLEHAALSAIERHFTRLADPNFAAVRVLDLWPDVGALVMEEVRQPSLRRLMGKVHRLSRSAAAGDVATAMRDAGAWLRALHAMPPLPDARPRHTRRADFLEFVGCLVDYLAATHRRGSLLRDLARHVEREATAALPDELPLGLAHGDFAPRNIFIAQAGQVAVIDTLGRWQAPIYEDIADFLVNLRMSGPQVMTLGLLRSTRTSDDWETAFLRGYFIDRAPPHEAIALFQIQSLLSRWAGVEHRRCSARGAGRMLAALRRVQTHFLRCRLRELAAGSRRRRLRETDAGWAT
jgi:hypothetical protein